MNIYLRAVVLFLCTYVSLFGAKESPEYRKDSFFSPLKNVGWKVGLAVTGGYYTTVSGISTPMFGPRLSLVLKKKTRYKKHGVMVEISLPWYEYRALGETNEIVSSGIVLSESTSPVILPLPLDFQILFYKNGGKFLKSHGTMHPFFGFGFNSKYRRVGYLTTGTYYSSLGINLNVGLEWVFLPQSLGLRASLKGFLDYDGQGIVSNFGSRELRYGGNIDIGIVAYVFP